MPETSQFRFERYCRLCAEEQDATIMLFSDEAEAMLLQKKIKKYLLIEIQDNDRLPKNICVQCCTKLQIVCEFIDKAHEAKEILTKRSLILEHYRSTLKSEFEISDSENNTNKLEVNVDPRMILQNFDDELSMEVSGNNLSVEDVTHLHDVDGENVTIKLIRNGELKSNSDNDEKIPKVKPFSCNTCGRSFYSELALKNHFWIHINEDIDNLYICKICSKSFEQKSEFVDHLLGHKIKNAVCQLCGKKFKSQRTYKTHMTKHTSKSVMFSCKECGLSYSSWSRLQAHSITHSNERPYVCHECKKRFKRKQELKFHINSHTGNKPYKCPFCEKCFASTGSCYSHRHRLHPGKCQESKRKKWAEKPKENQTTKNNIRSVTKYQCNLCEHSFLRRDNYIYHIYQHTGDKPYQCSFCPENFVTRKGLLIHHDKEHSSQDRPLALLTKNILLK